MKLKLTEAELERLEELEESIEEQEEDEDYEELDRGDDFNPDEDDDEDEVLDSDDEDEEDDDSEEDDEDDSDDEDEEDDEDEDEDDEEDSDEDDDEDEDEGNSRIPRYRLNEVIAQRDAERERTRWLEEQLEKVLQGQGGQEDKEPEPEPYDFDGAEDRYIELVLDGEKQEAIRLRKEIEAERQKAYESKVAKMREEAEASAKTASQSTLEEEKYERTLQQTLETHDFFNHDSKGYNASAVKLANRLMAAYMNEGLTKSEALKSAVEDVVPIYGNKKSTEKAKERSKTARKKAAEAQRKQPKDTSRRGSSKSRRDLEAVNVAKMSEKDFDSLTAKEKAILRGDG